MSILAVFIKTLFWSTIIFIIIDVLHNAFEKLKSKPKTKNNNRTINITVNINIEEDVILKKIYISNSEYMIAITNAISITIDERYIPKELLERNK